MAKIPKEGGVRDRFLAELPMLLDQINLIETDTVPELVHETIGRRKWWMFWVTDTMIYNAVLRSFRDSIRFSDDREGRVHVTVKRGGGIPDERTSYVLDRDNIPAAPTFRSPWETRNG